MKNTVTNTIEEIFSLYEKYGMADYIGEPVSQIEHMSQSAQLAIKEGFDDEVVLAAFFHDIGHICVASERDNTLNGYGVKSHEKIGADYLRKKGFPERISRLVENHVQAKRYLTFKYPSYYEQLSEASKVTLELQGGIMSAQEAKKFEADPFFEITILMRKWDELAKEMFIPVMDIALLKSMAQKVLHRNLDSYNPTPTNSHRSIL